ncbi:CRISPR-associated protein Cas4 [Microbacteriaceae bacterium 4G12]
MQWDDLKATGLQVQYLKVCKRKLWLHAHQIAFEDDYDKVKQGKILHEMSYQRKKSKEVLIDNLIRIDLMDEHYVGEVKSSSKMLHADQAQLLYYLFVLDQMGIKRKGKIHYPKEKRVDEIELTEQDKLEISKWLEQIQQIIQQQTPPKKEKLRYCTKCAYYEFCWVGEEE